jgi:1-acyl-sn-glycerol-3-phosphate acyltransferase
MKNLSLTLWSVWLWVTFTIGVLLWLPLMSVLWLVTAPFDPPRYWTGYVFRKLPVLHLRLNPLWTFTISGELPDNPRHPYVFVANHESFVDILLISGLPWEMKWLAKAELFRLPVVGWLLRLAKDIPVDRRDRASAAAALQQCARLLSQHVSVMIFPEGTRATGEGELLPFRDGAFRLAIESGVPIVPLAVHGAATALRSHDWRFGRSTAQLRVLEPISTTGMTLRDVPALREQTRGRIVDALAEMGRDFGAGTVH